MENTGRKRIQFLTHKIWHFEKLIGKVSVWTNSSAFFYHVYTNKHLHYVHPPPLSAGDFSCALSGLVKSLSILLNRHAQQKTSGIQGTSPGIFHTRFLYLLLNNFFRDLQRPWLCFRWLIFCRGSTIRTEYYCKALQISYTFFNQD